MNLKLSKNKVNYLTKLIVQYIENNEDLDYLVDLGEIRLKVYHLITEELEVFADIEETAREKLSSQKKSVPENSREWEILFRKYSNDELNKLPRIWD